MNIMDNPAYEPSYYDGDRENNATRESNVKEPYRCSVHRQKHRSINTGAPRIDIRRDPSHDYYSNDDRYLRGLGFVHPYWLPCSNPYHCPAFLPGIGPPDVPYLRDERDEMRAQPFNMYDPMEMYYHRYPTGRARYSPTGQWGYPMPTTRYPRSSQEYNVKGRAGRSSKQVGFQDEVEEEQFDPDEADPYLIAEAQQSKLKARLALLIVIVILLIACIILAAVALAMEPWLQQEKGTITTEVGLWRTCREDSSTGKRDCDAYSETGKESPYKSMDLLQWCMIVGIISVFIALVLAIITIIVRKSRYVRGLIFTMIFFTIGATVLFSIVIAYVNEHKDTKDWITGGRANLKTGTMFAIACAAAATSGMALILCCVMAFIYEPYVESERRKSQLRGGTRYEYNDDRDSNVLLQSEPAIISRAEGSLEKKNPREREYGHKPLVSGWTDNKAQPPLSEPPKDTPPNEQPEELQMKSRDHYPIEGVDTVKQKGKKAHQRKVQVDPPSYFKRNPGNGTGTMINPNANPTKASKEGKNISDGVAVYGGDYNTYFNEPY